MSSENYYKDISHVVYINTDEGKSCEHCKKMVGGEDFSESINHFIDQHGYKLLHVGQETSRDSVSGTPWHMTVAVLGK